MPTSSGAINVQISRSPAVVFDALTRLGSLRDRIGTSGTYSGTEDLSDDPVRVGSTYVDRTPIGRLRGEVLEVEADRRLVFRQALRSGALDVLIAYQLAPSGAGTRLVRTGEITTRGWLALVHPIVVWATRAENRRMMTALKGWLENSET